MYNLSMDVNKYEQLLNQKGLFAFVPTGISMWPTLKSGKHSVIIVKKQRRLRKMDVAFYKNKSGDRVVLHRVLQVKPKGYITCGDSMTRTEFVLEEQVLGVMKGYYKGSKYVGCDYKAYKRKVTNWYKYQRIRNIRLKNFYFWQRVKNKLNRIFSRSEEK